MKISEIIEIVNKHSGDEVVGAEKIDMEIEEHDAFFLRIELKNGVNMFITHLGEYYIYNNKYYDIINKGEK